MILKNPHSILAVLDIRPQDIYEIRLSSLPKEGVWETIHKSAIELGLKVTTGQDVRRHKADRKNPGSGRTGNSEAEVKPNPGISLEALLDDPGENGLWLALDTLQDPQNLGAIFRTAACFGVRGILLTRDRSAPLSEAAYDVASGGIEHVPFSIQTNLSRAMKLAKERGLWVLGTSEHAESELRTFSSDRPWLLVLGNEESGLRRLTLENCDATCRIPAKGKIASLNVSVAAGVLIHHLTG